jgi:hypothetical protein
MQTSILTLGLGILMFISSLANAASPETQFWKWFQDHEKELYDFEKDQTRVFDSLGTALKKVHADLTFEFAPKKSDGRREFVISAGGIKSAFPKVEALSAAAPKLDRWIVIKFRPRRPALNDLQYNEKNVKASEVRYWLFKDEKPNKVGVMVFLPGYRKGAEKDDFGQIGYLFLDEALGEYDVETRVGAIVFEEQTSKYFARSRPLSELGSAFDDQFKSKP